MRELEFRAWDTKERQWLREFDVAVSGDGEVYYYSRGISDDGYIHPHNHLELMLYTGLTDIIGKRIYEGDIIRYNISGTNQKTWISEIIWVDGCLLIKKENSPPITNDGIYNIQVVGNIYENPELLEVKR